MTQVLTNYGTSGQLITVSLAPGGTGLASGSARASTAIDNTSTEFVDVLVQLVLKSGASGVLSTGFVNVYAYGSSDGGTDYTEGATGSDAAITLTSPTNLRLIGVINMVANAVVYTGSPMSVAAAFGGVLPQKWGIVIENQSGAALDTTEANHKKFYQGITGLLQ